MRALVTGGAGFIGSNLVAALVARDISVTVLDTLVSGFASNLPKTSSVRFLEGDVRDAAVVADAMAGASLVFHLAASVGNQRSIDNPLLDADTNVMGTIQVLEAARREGVVKVVASSSAGIFGQLVTLPIREDHPLEPDSPYGATKLCMEKLCLAYGKLHGLEIACLRYFNVYGPNQRYDAYGNVIPIFVFRLLRGDPLIIFGDGEQTRDFVHVRDVVDANIRAALTPGVRGAFNIGSGTRISINNLARMIGEAARYAPVLNYASPRPGDVRDSLADISAAQAAFGYAPSVSWQEGLQEYVDWARTELSTRQAA